MNTLVNLALLETLKAHDFKDEIDLYIPFLAVTISEIKSVPFSTEELKSALKHKFGFTPPEAAVKVLLARCRKRNLISIENHCYLPNSDNLKVHTSSFDQKILSIEQSLDHLTVSFIEFAKNNYNINIDTQDSINILLEYIERNITGLIHFSPKEISGEVKNRDHLAATFIAWTFRHDNRGWSMFEQVINGTVLATYLYFADKKAGTEKKIEYSNITAYLDTPILVGLLGLSGKTSESATRELIKLLTSLEIKLRIFDKTLYELESLFYAWKRDIESGNYEKFNPKTLELLKLKGYDGPRIETEITLIEDTLKRFDIDVELGFNHIEAYQCNEEELGQTLSKKLSSGPQDKARIEHDLTCVSRIHNQRKNKTITNLNQNFTVFVTPNTGLIKTVNSYFSMEFKKGIPLLVSDNWITTIFWLKSGEAFKGLPSQTLLANAFATLNRTGTIWENFKSRFNEIIKRGELTQDQYERVRFDSKLLHEVYDASVTIGENFEDSDVYEIVDSINKRQKIEQQLAIESARNEEQQKYTTLESQYNKKSSQVSLTEHRLESISQKFSWIICAIIFLLIFYATFLTLPFLSQKHIGSLSTSSLATTSFFISSLFQLLGSLAGFDLLKLKRLIHIKIFGKLKQFFFQERKDRIEPQFLEPNINNE